MSARSPAPMTADPVTMPGRLPPVGGASGSGAWLDAPRPVSRRRCRSSSSPLLFLIMPTLSPGRRSAFVDHDGNFTLQNIVDLASPQIVSAVLDLDPRLGRLRRSRRRHRPRSSPSPSSAAACRNGIRSTVMTFSGVASQFRRHAAGLRLHRHARPARPRHHHPQAVFGFDIYRGRLQPAELLGPDAHLSLLPDSADDPDHRAGHRRAEAANGARRPRRLAPRAWQFWRYVGLPVLWPNLLGTLSLLFANAFGAIATAYALTGSSLNIVPILLYAQIRGDVLHNPGPRRRAGARHDRHHRAGQRHLPGRADPRRAVAEMSSRFPSRP